MTVYFSAAGNCACVAQRLATDTDDPAVSLQNVSTVRPSDAGRIGFVFPTCFWGLPSLVRELLPNLPVGAEPDTYLFFVAACGTTSGQTGALLDRMLTPRGLSLSARCSVKMPDSWTPVFALSDSRKVGEIQEREEPQIQEILSHIRHSVGSQDPDTRPVHPSACPKS